MAWIQNNLELLNAIGSIATAAALFVAIWQIVLSRRQAMTDFEDEIDREYREIINQIPVKVFLGEELSDSEYQEALPYLYQYIDLSNKEVFLRQQNRVGKKTWKFWCDGIQSNLDQHPFDRAWCEIKEKANSSFSELRDLEASCFQKDPHRGLLRRILSVGKPGRR
jgi:hypothetical protein